MNISKYVKLIRLKNVLKGKERIGKTDLGVLKVAFMVAAVDGEVSPEEYAVFTAMAKKCRGYTPENAEKALDEAMHSAGYLLLMAKRVKQADLVKAFVREAKCALPDGFAHFEIAEVRQALATWIAMGMGDGDYSAREKACIEALRKTFAQMKVDQAEDNYRRAMSLSPAFRMVYAQRGSDDTVELVTKKLVRRLEDTLASLGDSADGERVLKELIESESK